jgi:hypothetical protein
MTPPGPSTRALDAALADPATRTADLGGAMGTRAFAAHIATGSGKADMPQTAIPFLFLRGGTSRGPYFNRADLPEDRETLARVLVAAVGSGHRLNIDGIGGGDAVTTKVAMLSRSQAPDCDVDYFFAQVSVLDGLVDYQARPAATSCPVSAPRRWRWGWSRRRATDDGPHSRGQHRGAGRGHRADPRRAGGIRGRDGHRRGAGHRGAGDAELHGCGRRRDRGLAALGQPDRHDRRGAGDLHGRRHAHRSSPAPPISA